MSTVVLPCARREKVLSFFAQEKNTKDNKLCEDPNRHWHRSFHTRGEGLHQALSCA